MSVELISHTPMPLKVIAFAKGLIQGKHLRFEDISDEQAEEEFIDCLRSAIFAPFEFVNFVFDGEGVTRAFTHQHVRTRTAAYMQESLRFSVREEGEFDYSYGPTIEDDPERRAIFDEVCKSIGEGYWKLVQMGAAPQDARGILPINIHTSIATAINYRSLVDTAGQRLCLQSQKEHRDTFKEIKELLFGRVHPLMGRYLAPSCSHNGFCSWGGRLDRPCPLQKIYPMKPEPFAFLEREKEIGYR